MLSNTSKYAIRAMIYIASHSSKKQAAWHKGYCQRIADSSLFPGEDSAGFGEKKAAGFDERSYGRLYSGEAG